MPKGTKEAFLSTVIGLFELIKSNKSEEIKAFLAEYDNDPLDFYSESISAYSLDKSESELVHICFSLLGRGQDNNKIAKGDLLVNVLSTNDTSERKRLFDAYEETRLENTAKNLVAALKGDVSTLSPSTDFQKFDAPSHFSLSNNELSPTFKGIGLVTQYWFHKYHAVISPHLAANDILENLSAHALLIQRELQRNPSDDFRVSFIINSPATAHFFPVIYIKENGSEAILIPDSVAGKSELDFAKAISEKLPNTPVFVVNDARQADHFSCKTDALVLCRDATAQLPSGAYRVPNLLKQLEMRSTPMEGNVSSVLLPDELLKTAQRPKFTASHTESSEKKVHKQETLSDFRKRYTGSFFNPMRPEDPAKNISTYLTYKGRQLAKNMIIQFYINALTASGYQWSDEKKSHFIDAAKSILSSAFKDKRRLDKSTLEVAIKELHEFAVTVQTEKTEKTSSFQAGL